MCQEFYHFIAAPFRVPIITVLYICSWLSTIDLPNNPRLRGMSHHHRSIKCLMLELHLIYALCLLIVQIICSVLSINQPKTSRLKTWRLQNHNIRIWTVGICRRWPYHVTHQIMAVLESRKRTSSCWRVLPATTRSTHRQSPKHKPPTIWQQARMGKLESHYVS